jgi:NTE family protein
MSDATRKVIEIGLVLQGGGALGAYECGAVTRLIDLMNDAERQGQPSVLKAVTGVSIGAVNAACIVGSHGRGDASRRLNALWDDLVLQSPDFWPRQARRDLSLFGLPGFYAPRPDLWTFPTWTHYYDNSPLVATLTRHVDFAALNASPTLFVVSAVDVESGELTRFRNAPDGTKVRERRRDRVVAIEPCHIRASGSLPPPFAWTPIGKRVYWDGGLVNNTPLSDAIDAFSHGPDVYRLLIVMNLYPLCAQRPRNMAEVEDRMHELSYGNRLLQDRDQARRLNDLVAIIEDLAPLVPPDSLDAGLKARVEAALELKIIRIVDLDMQEPSSGADAQDPSDDQYGLRDFSLPTVSRRREHGSAVALKHLRPLFDDPEHFFARQARH